MSVNQQTQQLAFLQEKIEHIGSAIFFNQSESVLKLPTSLVSNIKVDDFGYLWFFVTKPKQNLQEFDNEFPVRMDFFKKGVDFFLQVNGKGWVVVDPEEQSTFLELFGEVDASQLEDMVLVKVKMLKAEYYETQMRTKHSWWYSAVNSMTAWFRSTNNVGSSTYYPAS